MCAPASHPKENAKRDELHLAVLKNLAQANINKLIIDTLVKH